VSELRRQGQVEFCDPGEVERHLESLAGGDAAPGDPRLRVLIQGCTELLPAKPKEALVERLRFGGVQSDQQIAQRLKVKLNTFLQNVTRARILADCLARHGVNLEEERR
jgi:hypothetical protein